MSRTGKKDDRYLRFDPSSVFDRVRTMKTANVCIYFSGVHLENYK